MPEVVVYTISQQEYRIQLMGLFADVLQLLVSGFWKFALEAPKPSFIILIVSTDKLSKFDTAYSEVIQECEMSFISLYSISSLSFSSKEESWDSAWL